MTTRYSRRRYGSRAKFTPYNRGGVDPYYQLLYATITSDADEESCDSTAITLPQPPTQYGYKYSNIIYELLWVEFQWDEPPATQNNMWLTVRGGLRTQAPPNGLISDLDLQLPSVVAVKEFGWNFQFTTSGCSEWEVEKQKKYDFQDAKGNGLLYASNQLYLCIAQHWNNGATYAANTINMRLAYRYRRVPLQEYLGILSTQQQIVQT